MHRSLFNYEFIAIFCNSDIFQQININIDMLNSYQRVDKVINLWASFLCRYPLNLH